MHAEIVLLSKAYITVLIIDPEDIFVETADRLYKETQPN